MDRKKVLELDKICRVCICERKDMRPLFNEKVAEMLMECTSVTVEPTEGWPDKICVQCVHSVSRCHAFKTLVERSDKELREYIKSLTIRMVIDETPDSDIDVNKLQHQMQHSQMIQQQVLHDQNQQEHLQLKSSTCKLQKLPQKQVKQSKLIQQQHQQHVQSKKKVPISRKNQTLCRKQSRQRQQQQQEQSQQTQQLTDTIQHHAQQHTQQVMQTQNISLAENVTQRLQTLPPPPLLTAPPQLLPLSSNPSSIPATTMLPTTSTAIPQQILLPNGQIITTAQILTTNSCPPQLAQIITNPSLVPQPTVSQFTPHLLQTSNGQTLQLIQQPNGQQVIQFVQLVPQRTNNGTTTTTTAIIDNDHITMVDEETFIEQSEQHLIDDDDDLEEPSLDVHETGTQIDDREQVCETIVVDDEQMHIHHQILGENEVQELEYLEDITGATASQQQRQHLVLHEQHAQLLSSGATVIHDVGDDDADIIEEIHIEEEMLDDDGEDSSPILLDTTSSEFISERDEDMVNQHRIISENNEECNDVEDDSGQALTHYTVVTEEDDEALMEADVNTVLQMTCSHEVQKTQIIHNNNVHNTKNNTNSNSPISKRQKRYHNNKSIANSRQLAATATSIAAAGDDEFEIDTKLIAEFINQQTSVLSSGRYMCNLCRQEFRLFKGLQNHMHSHSNWIRVNCKKLPQCEICHKSFKGPGMLKMHMKSHQSAGKIPTCQICGKSFKTKAILYRHRQTHQLRWYLCAVDNCRKGFSSPLSLKAHIDRKHPDATDTAKYKCGECHSIFYTISELNNHIKHSDHGATITSLTTIGSPTLTNVNSTTFTNTLEQSDLNHANLSIDSVDTNSITGNILNANTATVTMTEVVNSNGEVFLVTPA